MVKVSVVMAVHNGERFLSEAIESILDQTFKDFEFIIIDDGSTDKTPKILEKYSKKDERIRLIAQNNQGLTKSLNRGISKARGKYIARMDADDVSLPERLETQYEFMERNEEVVMCGTLAEEVDENGKKLSGKKAPKLYLDSLPTDPHEIRRAILRRNPFVHPSIMARRQALIKTGGYDESLAYSQDYDLYLRLIQKGQLANIPLKLIRFRRVLGEGVSFKHLKEQERCALKARWKALKSKEFHWYEAWKFIVPVLAYLLPARIQLAMMRMRNA